jgi:DNA-binding MarR family transcriptional regulator
LFHLYETVLFWKRIAFFETELYSINRSQTNNFIYMNKKSIGSQIHITETLIHNYIDTNINGKIDNGMTGIEGMTLKYLCNCEKEVSTTELKEYTHLSKASTSQTLNSLVEKGLITMSIDPLDKRKKTIQVTEKGREVKKQFELHFAQMNALIEKDMSEEEKEILQRLLKQIRANLGVDY